jgi:chromosome segregation ATPase
MIDVNLLTTLVVLFGMLFKHWMTRRATQPMKEIQIEEVLSARSGTTGLASARSSSVVLDQNTSELQDKIKQLEALLSEERTTSEQQIEQLSEQLSEKENSIEEEKERTTKIQREYAVLQTEMDASRAEVETMQQELTGVRAENDIYLRELRDLQNTPEASRTTVSQNELTILLLETEMQTTTETLNTTRKDYEAALREREERDTQNHEGNNV